MATRFGARLPGISSGTAAVITPVGRVLSNHGEFEVNDNQPGEITMAMRERLTHIQRGEYEDTHGWVYTLVDAEN